MTPDSEPDGAATGDEARTANPLSVVLIRLMKGVVHAGDDPRTWQDLLDLRPRIRDHVAVLGLELTVAEAEGHAFLRQRTANEDEPELPRLIARRPLGYHVSLLLVLLRKKLAEFDARGGETRLVLDRDQIADLFRVFLPDSSDQARWNDRIDRHLRKVVELGFVQRLSGDGERYEVARVLKTFVDAQWIAEFDERLAAYRAQAADATGESAE